MAKFIYQRASAALGLLAASALGLVAPNAARAEAVFAESSVRSFFTNGSSRDRMIQVCVVCMALALFIIMKKFAPDGRGAATPPRDSSQSSPPNS